MVPSKLQLSELPGTVLCLVWCRTEQAVGSFWTQA